MTRSGERRHESVVGEFEIELTRLPALVGGLAILSAGVIQTIQAEVRLQFIVGVMMLMSGLGAAVRSRVSRAEPRLMAFRPVLLGLVPLLFALFGWLGGVEPFGHLSFWIWLIGSGMVLIGGLLTWISRRSMAAQRATDREALHVPKLVRRDLLRVWQMRCSCGWRGPLRLNRDKAVGDHTAHVAKNRMSSRERERPT